MAATQRLSAYRLITSTGIATGTVELHCPRFYAKFGKSCGRLLAKMPPIGSVSLSCPRCHQQTTFRFERST